MVPDRFAPVLAELSPLAERFRGAAGGCTWSAARCATCSWGGRSSTGDVDATTDARPDEIKAILDGWAEAMWTQGERFGTIGARRGSQAYEITTHRAEVYEPESRKPDVVFADAIEVDLSRRDFTVNAMALELTTRRTDARRSLRRRRRSRRPRAAHPDLARRRASATTRCACCGPPGSSPATSWSRCRSWSDAVSAMRHRLSIVSAERIRDELDKLITRRSPGAGLWFVIDTGLAEEFLPELPAMRLEQDPIHRHKDVLSHTIAVVENVRPPTVRPASPVRLPAHPAGGAVPRHRQAEDARLPQGQGRDLPPPRGGRRTHDP